MLDGLAEDEPDPEVAWYETKAAVRNVLGRVEKLLSRGISGHHGQELVEMHTILKNLLQEASEAQALAASEKTTKLLNSTRWATWAAALAARSPVVWEVTKTVLKHFGLYTP